MGEPQDIVSSVKEWISIDNEIKTLQKEIKVRRERKKALTDQLVNVLKENEIDGWDTRDGKLEYCTTKVKSTINKDHLMKSLEHLLKDSEQAKVMTQYILDSREIKQKEGIKRK